MARHGSGTLIVVFCFDGIEIGVHGGFGIDYDVLAAGKFNDEIGSETFAFVGGGGRLRFEVAVLLHACHFHDSAELHFAPLATTCGLSECFNQFTCLTLKTLVGLGDVDHLLFQASFVAFADFLAFADLVLDFFQRLGNRFHHLLNGDFAFFHFMGRLLLLSFEAVFCQ